MTDNIKITRRDFVKGTLVGSGSMLLNMPAPLQARSGNKDWDGFAGIGDYARSNGNTKSTADAAHLIRGGAIDAKSKDIIDTGESYDLVIIGGGFAGMGAVRTFQREARPGQTCLLLENHAITGGAAKRNEFLVNGYKITGPQASLFSVVPWKEGSWYDKLWNDLGVPREPNYQKLNGYDDDIRVAKVNVLPMLGFAEQTATCGYFFDKETFGVESYWDVDSYKNGYANTAFSESIKADLNRLRLGDGVNQAGDNWQRWLDGITYKDYLENVLSVKPETTRLLDNLMTMGSGLGGDVVSALHAMKAGLPGFDKGFGGPSPYRLSQETTDPEGLFSFPGGNDAIFRLLLKSVLPEAIDGGDSFEEVHDAPFLFRNFDRAENRVRIRLNSTAVHVKHDREPASSNSVFITYHRSGKLYRVKARGVVSAAGAGVNKNIISDLPDEHRWAFNKFIHGSNLIVNVALTNWRFLARLGISGCHYFSDNHLGSFCNIRHPMIFGKHQEPFDPDKPIVLTFYIGFTKPGLPAQEQAARVRWDLLSKSYSQIEFTLRNQMMEMFASTGFDHNRDIVGIILNRWGHSFSVETPGFVYGVNGDPSPLDIVKKQFGRIAFGHAEHNGLQEWFGGVENGERAVRQVMEVL